MKKLGLLAASLIVLNVAAEDECGCEEIANPFEGFSVYAGLGGNFAELQNKDDVKPFDKIKLNGFAGTLGAVYRYNCGSDCLIGAGFDLTFGNKKKEISKKFDVVDNGTSTNDNQITVKEADEDYGIKGKRAFAVGDNVTAKVKAKKLVVTPAVYLTFGKSFNNFLPELLLGGAYTGAKVDGSVEGKATTGGDFKGTASVKVKKFVPMVGLRFSYAVNENVALNLTGRYMFEAKKQGFKFKKNFDISAGVSYKF